MNLQHVISGLLTLPSCFKRLFYFVEPKLASSLVCLCVLSEMGYEIQDFIVVIYNHYYFTNESSSTRSKSSKKNSAILIFAIVHHSLTCVLGLPAILFYRQQQQMQLQAEENKERAIEDELLPLDWLCFDLQFSAGALFFVIEYTRHLDTTKKNELRQFLILTFLVLLCYIWTRLLRWTFISYKFIRHFYRMWLYTAQEENDESHSLLFLLVIGVLIILLFSILNVFGMVIPTYKRFMKFYWIRDDYSGRHDKNN